jgi:hypothetical protein
MDNLGSHGGLDAHILHQGNSLSAEINLLTVGSYTGRSLDEGDISADA